MGLTTIQNPRCAPATNCHGCSLRIRTNICCQCCRMGMTFHISWSIKHANMQTVKYTHQPNENNKNYSATNLSYTTEVAQTMVGIIPWCFWKCWEALLLRQLLAKKSVSGLEVSSLSLTQSILTWNTKMTNVIRSIEYWDTRVIIGTPISSHIKSTQMSLTHPKKIENPYQSTGKSEKNTVASRIRPKTCRTQLDQLGAPATSH